MQTPGAPALLSADKGNTEDPTLILLPFLGGSTHTWDEVISALGGSLRSVAIDLPGFGGAAQQPGYSVADMADTVAARIAALGHRRVVIVGHSMGGKIATVLAARAQAANDRESIAGLVLVSPSPPSPEPMSDSKRESMLASLGTQHADDLLRARSFVADNVGDHPLPEAILDRTAHEVLRMNRAAWVAWLESGSREDWSARVGILDLPSHILAGDRDGALGPDAQRRTTLTHLGQGRLTVVPGASHLLPLERPELVAAILQDFVRGLKPTPTPVPPSYLAFIGSDRLSAETRDVVTARLAGPGPSNNILDARQQRTLRAVLDRVIPQKAGQAIDLAGYIMARLASGKGDGWRYAVLPPDLDAYRQGLDKLAGQNFEGHEPGSQDALLQALTVTRNSADARWFEDVRSDAVAAYVAHPATLARLGYSGLGVGGATTPHRGFVDLEPNGREAWEPEPVAADRSQR